MTDSTLVEQLRSTDGTWDITALLDLHREAADAIEELQADRERLDWCCDASAGIWVDTEKPEPKRWWVAGVSRGGGPTLRAAIDAARSRGEEDGDG